MNSSIFFALTFEYKWRYKLSDYELSTIAQESMGLMMIQLALTLLIMSFSSLSPDLSIVEKIEKRASFQT